MDFHKLVETLNKIDSSINESVSECDTGCGSTMTTMPNAQQTSPANVNINMNAQGMDDIEKLLGLFTKVNPDMATSTSPVNGFEVVLAAGDATSDITGNVSGLDRDGDGDHDMDDHELETDNDIIVDVGYDDFKKEGSDFDTATTRPDVDVKDVDYMVNKLAGGMNKPKSTFPKVADGDNPMQRAVEGDELRNQIRNDLRKRLAEVKLISKK